MVRDASRAVVCPGQCCALHPDRQQAAEEPACVVVRQRQVDDQRTAGVDQLPEGEPVLSASEAVAQHRRERQQVCPVEGGLLHVRLVPPPLVHPEVEEPHDLRISDSEKQLLPEVLIGEEVGELGQREAGSAAGR